MKTLSFKGPLLKSDAFEHLKIKPEPGNDLLILPDVPARYQARSLFSGTESSPFITTFRHLAQKTNATGTRREVLSKTGSMILMRRAAADFSPSTPGAALVYQLVSLGADLKQNGISPQMFAEKTRGLPAETAQKTLRLADILAAFEKRMEAAGAIDNAGMMEELARKFESGGFGARRVIAAGFDRLAPSQKRVIEAAEKAGCQTALVIPAAPDTAGVTVSVESFPSLASEAEFAAAEIRAMAGAGTEPPDCAVILRNMLRGGEIRDVFERSGLSVDLRAGTSAGEASGISTLLKQFLLTAGAGFASPEFTRLVRNPLLQNFFAPQCRFETARAMDIEIAKTGGRGSLESVVSRLPSPAARRVLELAETISKELAITEGGAPPESAAIGGLRRRVDATGASGAAGEAGAAVRDILREADILCGRWDGDAGSWEDLSVFVSEILAGRACPRKTPDAAPSVTVMDALEARGTSYKTVFVLDCADGSFPRSRPDGMLLGDDERRAVNDRLGVCALTTAADYMDRERLIWNSVVSCAGESLHISFARDSARGGVSRFAGEMAEVRTADGGGLPTSPYCAEAAMAAEMARRGTVGGKTGKLLAAADPFFALARHAVRGAEAEKSRLRPRGEVSGFEGAAGAEAAAERTIASVGGVESVGRCPFVFFCSRILGLGENIPAGRVPPPADTGALYHAALRFVLRERENAGDTARTLERFLSDGETKKAHCRVPDAVWELQTRRAAAVLTRFLAFEDRRMSEGKLKPELFEEEVEMEIAGITVRGKLDRMDRDETGGVRVVDYKKSGVEGSFCNRGRLQVPLYLLAVSRKLGAEPRGGDYLSVERAPDKKPGGAEKCDDAMRFAESNINLVKAGMFPPFPLTKTDDFPYAEFFPAKGNICASCSYGDVCRIKSGVSRSAERRRG